MSILALILRLVSREQLVPSKVAGEEKAEATAGKKKSLHRLWSFHSCFTAHPCQFTPTPVSSHCISSPPVRKTRVFIPKGTPGPSCLLEAPPSLGLHSKQSCRHSLTHPEQKALQKSCRLQQPKYNPSSNASGITSNAKVSEYLSRYICTNTATCESTHNSNISVFNKPRKQTAAASSSPELSAVPVPSRRHRSTGVDATGQGKVVQETPPTLYDMAKGWTWRMRQPEKSNSLF